MMTLRAYEIRNRVNSAIEDRPRSTGRDFYCHHWWSLYSRSSPQAPLAAESNGLNVLILNGRSTQEGIRFFACLWWV